MSVRNLLALAILAGASSCAQDRATDGEGVDARWTLKAGDALAIRMVVETATMDSRSIMELDGLFRVREVDADGVSRGTVETVRILAREEGKAPSRFLYENGALKHSEGTPQEESHSMEAKLRKVVESRLLPTGVLATAVPGEPGVFANWPLGAQLPGKRIAASETWKGSIRAAYSDVLELEYRFSSVGELMRITGRSTAESERDHQIRVRVEGTFLSALGCVGDGRIEIDFSPLGSDRKTSIQFVIERR